MSKISNLFLEASTKLQIPSRGYGNKPCKRNPLKGEQYICCAIDTCKGSKELKRRAYAIIDRALNGFATYESWLTYNHNMSRDPYTIKRDKFTSLVYRDIQLSRQAWCIHLSEQYK